MKLFNLLQQPLSPVTDISISGLALNSRLVEAGDLFFALSGADIDGIDYVDDAIKNGAVAVLVDREISFLRPVPIIFVENLKQHVGVIASRFFNYPTRDMLLIGVTGTNGKTSVVQLIANAFSLLGKKAATIGTIGYGVFGEPLSILENTTPNAILLQEILARFKKDNVKVVAMEVSSHALDQYRDSGILFDVGVLTNITQDHLDYHDTLEQYACAKKKLFDRSLKAAVFNVDDAIGKQWAVEFSDFYPILHYGLKAIDADISAKNIILNDQGVTAILKTPQGKGKIQSRLLGRFNVSNLLAMISVLLSQHVAFDRILSVLPQLKPIVGRMQTFVGENKPLVVVDYAHTPDALTKALSSLKEHCAGKLVCVFGCGGDRDKTKRPKMAKAAEALADVIVVTNDNPRTESADQIIQDIFNGFKRSEKILIEKDRKKAIKKAIELAGNHDIILIAGKGHEDYQMVGKEKIHLSDIEIVSQLYRCRP